MKLSELDIQLIAAIEKHVATDYYLNEEEASAICDAIRMGKISIEKISDNDWSYDQLYGDVFNPECNDIDPAILRRDERNFKARIRNTGVWTFSARYWTGRCWSDSFELNHGAIGGFVGNDFFGSGYELQIMLEALTAYNAQNLDAEGFVIDPYRVAA